MNRLWLELGCKPGGLLLARRSLETSPSGAAIGLGLDALTGGAISISAAATASGAFTTATSTLIGAGVTATSTLIGAGSSALMTIPAVSSTLSIVDCNVICWGSMFREDGSQWGGKRFGNWLKMEAMPFVSLASMFRYDKSASGFEKVMQTVNTLTGGEVLQDQIGYGLGHLQNIGGYVDAVGYYQGRTTIRLRGDYIGSDLFRGISFGHYVFGHNMALNPDDIGYDLDLFAHEFGHTYQSRTAGPLYLFKYGIPSALYGNLAKSEEDADWRAYNNLGIWPHGYSRPNNRMKWWEVGFAPMLWPFMWGWNH